MSTLISTQHLPHEVRDVLVEINDTKSADHGDYACNFALIASKKAGLPPRAVGELLKKTLEAHSDFLQSVEIAGPGFLNFRIVPSQIALEIKTVLDQGDKFGTVPTGNQQKVNVEFVSVNPNGPITVGSGRGAAFGDALCRVLEAAGFQPFREYYINDGVNSLQMRLFAESVKHYYLELIGQASEMPENGYKGSYVADVAVKLRELFGDENADQPLVWFQTHSQELMLKRQHKDLLNFRVEFDRIASEQALHNGGKVISGLELLEARGTAYRAKASQAAPTTRSKTSEPLITPQVPADQFDEQDEEAAESEGEALWLRSTEFGDDKDRVLVRADGRPTYIAADVAYLQDKFDRGFPKLKLILGPDHHGYINRLYAACQASGHSTGREGEFEIVIYQVVRFVKEGKPARMRKRDGNIYELRDLIQELGQDAAPNGSHEEQLRVGADVARFFFLMRSHETHMDFDIDLATKQSDDNPVFYSQYAHARICSVIEKAAQAGLKPDPGFDPNLLIHPRESQLVKKILDLPFEVERAAKDYGVHRLSTYAVELGRTFHHFYDACRVVQSEEPALSQARLALCVAARIALANALKLLGISAPTRMERAPS